MTTNMANALNGKIFMRIFCTLALFMFPDRTVQADSTAKTTTADDQLVMLTKRMSELELSYSRDVGELTKRVQELSDLREIDKREMTRLNQQVRKLQLLHVKHVHKTSILTQRIEEIDRRCDEYEQVDISKQIPTPSENELPRYNTSVIPLSSNAKPRETMITGNDRSTSRKNLRSKFSERSGRSQSRPTRLINRVSSVEDNVAFHAILANTISDPSTNHPVIYNQLMFNTGGANYSTNTGVFRCPSAGIYVFSWSIFVRKNQYIYTELVRNNDGIGSSLAGEDTISYTAGSATAATHLEVGDEVWVRVCGHESGSDVLANLSMFTGFRL
ncbi:uncharacterized protein LOC117335511 [Pecten maximus]|uniref:uncharacterized protein LOC117335511 n=1 Tax=Pecten maximus TaxID=6579 RepID=UPI0014587B53|nr:uncharacterized protein LOC117335511 [Pecten maximus]